MPTRTLESCIWLPAPREEVFGFFADAGNLEALTPPWLRFRILTPAPVEMREGTLIDYRIRLRGLPMRWRSRISRWEPPHRFVDEQVRGPYRRWRHEHEFIARGEGTLCIDRVEYRVAFDRLVHSWLVGPDLERIFAFRRRRLMERFGGAGGEGSGRDNRADATGRPVGGCAAGAHPGPAETLQGA